MPDVDARRSFQLAPARIARFILLGFALCCRLLCAFASFVVTFLVAWHLNDRLRGEQPEIIGAGSCTFAGEVSGVDAESSSVLVKRCGACKAEVYSTSSAHPRPKVVHSISR